MKRYGLCQVEREKVVTHSTLNLATGDSKPGRTETVTELCGTPLFSDVEERSGICRSCRSGWHVDGNKPTARGLKTIAEAK